MSEPVFAIELSKILKDKWSQFSFVDVVLDPRVLKRFLGTDSVARVALEHFKDQRLRVL